MSDLLRAAIEVATIAVVVAAVLLIRDRRRPRSWLEQVRGERVLIHTTDDQTIEGSLIDVLPDGLVLRAPRLIDDRAVNVAGDLFIPRSKVSLVQRHAPGGDS